MLRLPQSLYGRLMLVLLAGLMIAQLLSAAINLQERGQLLLRTSGMQSAQRIADTALLLDSLDAAEKKRIVALLNVPPQIVVLSAAPMVVGVKAADSPLAANFAGALQSALGDRRPIRVAESAALVAAMPPGPGYGRRRAMLEGKEFVPGMYRSSVDGAESSGGVAFLAQVQLRDGQWLIFDTQVPKDASSLPFRLIVTLGILLLAVLALSFIAVRWLTRPLHVLASAADALGRDLHCPPIPEDGPSEVRQAAHAFNTMQARLARFIEDRTRILAAMSHDLKTPITRLRLRADMLDDEPLRARFEKDLLEMEAMVTATLDFMRGLGGEATRQPIDIMALLESLQADHEEMGRKVRVEGRALEPYLGVAPLLKRCLSNLLDNAVLYGEEARVIVEDTPECLTLRVRDRGPGIPAGALEKVFDPFYRLDDSRNRETGGTGLGLTIARSIAQDHGGDVLLGNLAEGGLEAVVKLPRERMR